MVKVRKNYFFRKFYAKKLLRLIDYGLFADLDKKRKNRRTFFPKSISGANAQNVPLWFLTLRSSHESVLLFSAKRLYSRMKPYRTLLPNRGSYAFFGWGTFEITTQYRKTSIKIKYPIDSIGDIPCLIIG